MKLKLAILKNENFIKVLNKLVTCKIPPIKAYWLLKLIKIINSGAETLENARKELIMKYGKQDKEGNISVEDAGQENLNNFIKEFTETMNIDFEIPGEKIKIGLDIKDKENKDALFSVEELILLENVIDFEE